MLLMVVVVKGRVARLKVCLREKEDRNGRWVRIEKRGVRLAIETVPRSISLKKENKERGKRPRTCDVVCVQNPIHICPAYFVS